MCPHSYNGPDRRDQPHFDPAPNLCYLLLQLELGERIEREANQREKEEER